MIEQRGLEDEADTLVENDPGLAALYAESCIESSALPPVPKVLP